MLTRHVRHNGEIKFNGGYVFVSELLAGETVALDEIGDGLWRVYFYLSSIANLDATKMKLQQLEEPNISQPGLPG